MSEMTLNAAEQPIDELVGWVKQHDFSLNLTTERLAFLIAIAVLSNERFDEELGEGELHDAFAIVTDYLMRLAKPPLFVRTTPSTRWSSSVLLAVLSVKLLTERAFTACRL